MMFLHEQFPELFHTDLFSYVHVGMQVQLMCLPTMQLDHEQLMVVTDTVVKKENHLGLRIIHTLTDRYDCSGIQTDSDCSPYTGFTLVHWEHTVESVKALIKEKQLDKLIGIDP